MAREPSMEEILSSIRRVIARDDPSPASNSAGVFAQESAETGPVDDDVLDLTETSVDRDGDELVELAAVPIGATLLADEPAAASRQSLDVLAAMLASGPDALPAATPAIASDISVNAMVEAALRPMLKNWLDANLPGVVERLVAREIARITGARL